MSAKGKEREGAHDEPRGRMEKSRSPARQERRHECFRGALNRLTEAFEVAGTDCINRSSELSRVMGAR